MIFFSGFPLRKATEYAKLRKPFLINDLNTQFDIQDRRSVYRILRENGIEMPRNTICNREVDDGLYSFMSPHSSCLIQF